MYDNVEKIDDDIMLVNYEVFVIFSFYGCFWVTRKLDSRRIIYNSQTFIINNFFI